MLAQARRSLYLILAGESEEDAGSKSELSEPVEGTLRQAQGGFTATEGPPKASVASFKPTDRFTWLNLSRFTTMKVHRREASAMSHTSRWSP